MALIEALTRTNTPLLLVFDGSAVGRGCATLMASVIYGKRALPVAWIVKKGTKGSFSADDHLFLLDQVRALVPLDVEVIFLGDGEFDSVELQQGLDRKVFEAKLNELFGRLESGTSIGHTN